MESFAISALVFDASEDVTDDDSYGFVVSILSLEKRPPLDCFFGDSDYYYLLILSNVEYCPSLAIWILFM